MNLIEHAADDRSPEAAALLLGGSVATTLVFLAITLHTLRDFERLQAIYRPLRVELVIGAALALLLGMWAPVPWLLALLTVAILSGVWWSSVVRWMGMDNPEEALPEGSAHL